MTGVNHEFPPTVPPPEWYPIPPPRIDTSLSGWARLSREQKELVRQCDDVVDVHDTAEVIAFEALRVLEVTEDYDKAQRNIQEAIHKCRDVANIMGSKYGVQSFLIPHCDRVIIPLLDWLARLYAMKASPEVINEATYYVDWILHDERFSIFHICTKKREWFRPKRNPGSNPRARSVRDLELKYVHLKQIPEFKYVTHGASTEHMKAILKRGDIRAQAPEEMGLYPFPGFSIDATQWPSDAYLIFPFEKVRLLLRPTFYVRVPTFTLPVNNFHFCDWDCIHFVELVCEERVPVDLATSMYFPAHTRVPDPDLEKLAREKGLSVVYEFETAMSKWTDEARRFTMEYQTRFPDPEARKQYLPEFVMNYNLKLARIYGINWEMVQSREKEMLISYPRAPGSNPGARASNTVPKHLFDFREEEIDKRILPLIKLLNEKGYHTISSCEGHWSEEGLWSVPNVTIYADENQIARLKENLSDLIATKQISDLSESPDIQNLYGLTILPEVHAPYPPDMREKADKTIQEIITRLSRMSRMSHSNPGSNPGRSDQSSIDGLVFVGALFAIVFVGVPVSWWIYTSTIPPPE